MTTKTVPIDYSNGLLYWKNCEDQDLTIAVEQFVKQQSLDADAFSLLKSYFHHWAVCPFWQLQPAEQEHLIAELLICQTSNDLWKWLLDSALSLGIDPL